MTPARAKSWEEFLKFYSEKNKDRKTRLGIFDGGNDYWIESDMKLSGIGIDPQSEGIGMTIILETYTHEIRDVRSLAIRLSINGDEDGVDITDSVGKVTVMRFEK
jgi:hypothetical protein